MKDPAIMKPVFVQVLLTFVLMFWMAKERLTAIRAGSVKAEPGQRPLSWPGRAGTISNAFHNQLEVPMLFYAVVAFALFYDAIDWEFIWMAWAFVGFRVLQAIVHTTYNTISHRFIAFLLSNVALIAMWVNLGLTVFLGW
jgi:hypothetical protein